MRQEFPRYCVQIGTASTGDRESPSEPEEGFNKSVRRFDWPTGDRVDKSAKGFAKGLSPVYN